jgi:thioredoxin reductase
MPSWVEQANNNPKIKTILKANIKEIKGDKLVKKIILDNGKQMDIDGVFIEVGSVPTKVLTENLGVKTDQAGYIAVNAAQETNIEGVYAAGDITNASNNFRQIITAASEGAIASLSIFQYVNQKKAKK